MWYICRVSICRTMYRTPRARPIEPAFLESDLFFGSRLTFCRYQVQGGKYHPPQNTYSWRLTVLAIVLALLLITHSRHLQILWHRQRIQVDYKIAPFSRSYILERNTFVWTPTRCHLRGVQKKSIIICYSAARLIPDEYKPCDMLERPCPSSKSQNGNQNTPASLSMCKLSRKF